MLVRLWAALGGLDGPGKRALPIGEFLHPVSLACLGVMVVNDHVLKGSGLVAPIITGKLSDFAGLAFFPLLCTALLDLSLLVAARLGLRIDFSLRASKLWAAVIGTGLFFTAIKTIPAAATTVGSWLSVTGWKATIVCDPTDLLALVALFIPLWIGKAEISRVPLGRLEALERLGITDEEELKVALADVAGDNAATKAGDDAANDAANNAEGNVENLAAAMALYFTTGDSDALRKALARKRFGQKRARPKHRGSESTRID